MVGFGYRQMQAELGRLVFARVTSVRVEDGAVHPHFYGFARVINNNTGGGGSGTVVFFKRLGRQTGGIFIGPVRVAGGITHGDPPPKKGQLVCGEVDNAEKGPAFKWFVDGADVVPLLAFTRVLGHRVRRRHAREMKLHDGREDLLYMFARLVYNGDVSAIADDMMNEEPSSPSSSSSSSIHDNMSVQEFALFSAEYVRDPSLLVRLRTFMCRRRAPPAAVQNVRALEEELGVLLAEQN